MPISLDKFEKEAPELLSLAKKAKFSLSKYNLDNIVAEVAFVLDASGSMIRQYQQGQVQSSLERVFPLAAHFDNNQTMETWAFADKQEKLTSISFGNYKDYVNQDSGGWQKWMQRLNSSYNNEPVVMRAIIKEFFGIEAPSLEKSSGGFFGFGKKSGNENTFAPIQKTRLPIWILFISDGGVAHNEDIEFLIKWSSTLPIFWQFVGIGGSSYGALEKFDSLQGRFIDNANFFAIDNLQSITEQALYDQMVQEFPQWIQLAKGKGLLT